MSARIEKIVRPFQTGDVFTARVLAPEQPTLPNAPEPSPASWGGPAASNFRERQGTFFSGYARELHEIAAQRSTETVRVENPDDPSQFVEVERINSTVLVDDKTGEQWRLKLDWRGSTHSNPHNL